MIYRIFYNSVDERQYINMKQILLVILAAVLISVVIPLAVVELVPPGENAASTMPAPTDAPISGTAAELM